MEQTGERAISLTELFFIIRKHVFLISLVTIAVLLLSCVFLLIENPSYTATTTIFVESLQNISEYQGIDNPTKDMNELQYLTYTNTIDKALSSLDLSSYTKKFGGSDYSDILEIDIQKENLKNTIKTVIVKDSNTVKVSITNKNKQFALDFLKSLILAFESELIKEFSAQQMENQKFLLTQFESTNSSLQKVKQALEIFLKSTNTEYISFNKESLQIPNKEVPQTIYKEALQKTLTYIQLIKESVLSEASFIGEIKELEDLRIINPEIEQLVMDYGDAYRAYLYERLSRIIVLNTSLNASSTLVQNNNQLEEMELARTQLLNQLSAVIAEAEISDVFRNIIKNIEYSVLQKEESIYLTKLKQLPGFGARTI